jgi:hypothetical protein
MESVNNPYPHCNHDTDFRELVRVFNPKIFRKVKNAMLRK